jgi:patatin-like phospholipase/acyl hydrolase
VNSISEPPNDKFRILCVDGGGMRGLLSLRVIAELERLVAREVGRPARICDYFHLLSGTSTGGLIALALTAPEEISTETLAGFYRSDGPEIFRRSLLQKVRTLWGLRRPKYGAARLEEAVRARLGESRLSEARRDVLVTSYDMTNREPFFFKRWRAIESAQRDGPISEAALATSAAPTYFPSQGVNGRALVDGGVFAANPAVAAISRGTGAKQRPAGRAEGGRPDGRLGRHRPLRNRLCAERGA